jgi:hypothetical protein
MNRGGSNKYGAEKTVCRAGHKHPSKREAKRCDELHLLERAGEIESLEQQPRFYFEVNGVPVRHDNKHQAFYTADFRFIDRHSGKTIIEEVKGYAASDWPLRKALFRACYPELVLREV